MEPETDKTEVVTHTHEREDHSLPGRCHHRDDPSGRIDREHPIGGEMSDILRGLLAHIRLPWLTQRYAQTPVLALFSFINGCISIGLMSVLALITRSPFIFPSLGPTAFLFFYTPRAPSASPRNTLVGHTIGALAGYLSLVVTGLTAAGPALAVGVTWPRVIAAALSLGLTSGLMVLFKSPHPPAGATTLIISLGILTKPWQLLLLHGRRGAAHPASARHQSAGGHPLSPLEPDQGKGGKLRIRRKR